MPLIVKLLLIYLVGGALIGLVIDAALRIQAAKYFVTLVERYDIAPDRAHDMFVAAVEQHLLAAMLVALGIGAAVTYWLTRRSLRPLDQVVHGARQVTLGNYAVRVEENDCTEIGEVARTFNRMAESLVRLERLRKDMVVSVAHELRTPLTNIRGYLEALQEGVVPPTGEVFESLHDETLRLVSLSDNLLQLARAEAARDPTRIEVVRFDELVLRTWQLFQLKFSARRLRVELALEPVAVNLRAETDKVAQVLNNLFENAWRYAPEGSLVRVEGQLAERGVKLSIANAVEPGAEIDAGQLFERFYRGEASRSRDYGGAGLGLAIVKELVEAQSGAVGCQLADGDLVVWLTLPIEPEDRAA